MTSYIYVEAQETQTQPTGAFLYFEGESGVGDLITVTLETNYIEIQLAEESI